ncbi:allantoin permease, partial [Burkholderia pseudomallei]|nr:allantoin permease [Burkholderia pseudomallei]
MANMTQAAADGELDLSTLALPQAARMPAFSLTMAWWAVCSAVFYIVVGATLALDYGARNALIGMVLSVVSYGLVNAAISRYA